MPIPRDSVTAVGIEARHRSSNDVATKALCVSHRYKVLSDGQVKGLHPRFVKGAPP
jgi:hypothetical protein